MTARLVLYRLLALYARIKYLCPIKDGKLPRQIRFVFLFYNVCAVNRIISNIVTQIKLPCQMMNIYNNWCTLLYLNAENMLHGLSMDYAFASVVSLDCNNSNRLWMHCVVIIYRHIRNNKNNKSPVEAEERKWKLSHEMKDF